MSRRSRCAAVLALVACGAPSLVAAQQRDVCRLVRADSYLATAPGTPDERHYFRGPVHFTCGTDVTLRADSAVATPGTGRHLLIGDVFYQDSVKTLTADRLTYLRPLDRLHATGDVELRDRRDGSILRGPELDHHGVRRADGTVGRARAGGERPDGPPAVRLPSLDVPPRRATPDSGDAPPDRAARASTTRTIVRGGAHATILPRDSSSATSGSGTSAEDSAASPLEVDAERLEIVDRHRFYAVGDVRMTRGASRGFAREATYDRERGHLELDGAARIEDEAFNLLGERIDAFETEASGELDRVHATGDAVLLSEDMRLRASDIRVFFAEGELHRLVAAGRPDTLAVAGSTVAAAPSDTSGESARRPEGPPAPGGPPGEGESTDVPAPSPTERAGRPRLDSPDLGLTADSLDVLAPAQRLERVTAIGDAYAERAADSLATTRGLPEFARRDWVRGDTIIGHFALDTMPADGRAATATAEPADPAEAGENDDGVRTVLERIVASGGTGYARSLYRMAADSTGSTEAIDSTDSPEATDSTGSTETAVATGSAEAGDSIGPTEAIDSTETAGPPAAALPRINYVIARRLVMSIRNGSIAAIEADGGVRGTYSEPARPTAPDTTGVTPPPDSTGGSP